MELHGWSPDHARLADELTRRIRDHYAPDAPLGRTPAVSDVARLRAITPGGLGIDEAYGPGGGVGVEAGVRIGKEPLRSIGLSARLHESVLAEVSNQSGGNWIVDLSAMSYMGSSLLGLMVNVRQRVRQAGGKLVLCGMNPKLLQVFRTCSLERLFVIRAGRGEALEALAR